MSHNLILQLCYMAQISLQRNKTFLKDPVVFFLLLCFSIKLHTIEVKVDSASGKTSILNNAINKHVKVFYFLHLCLCPVQKYLKC